MSIDPNSFEAIKGKLSKQTLQDIEGLDVEKAGFMREECCGAVPEKMKNNMKLQEHIFLNTRMPATEWDKRTENVHGYKELNKKVAHHLPDATFTVSYIASGTDESLLRFQVVPGSKDVVTITEYSGVQEPFDLPWDTKGKLEVDRSSDYFIFICAHTTRDARCGYCGAVLIDLFNHALVEKMGEEGAKRVGVYGCSHVGGHVYAGNVLVYSRHGGVCYGLFKPTDVEAVVDAIRDDTGTIPESLRERIRGQMGKQ